MKDNSKLLKKYTDPFSKKAKEMAAKFDFATSNKDAKKLEELLSEAESVVDKENDASKAMIYYSLGTAHDDLAKLNGNRNEESFQKILYFFRKSIKLIELDKYKDEKYSPFVLSQKEILYTNYANALDHCGRKIAAIEQYKKVLSFHSDFGMALGNLGRVYHHYGILEYDDSHKDLFHYFAYHYLGKAIDCTDPNTHDAAKKCFKATMEAYAPEYIKNVLTSELSFNQYVYDNPEELTYREWCLQSGLFLNTLNDLPVAELCFAGDVIQLPNMIVGVHAKPIFHGMFSQLKQEYIYARYIYYSTLSSGDEPHFADKETYIKAYTDYAQYSIRLEKLKTAFKTLYGMFDKIAFFLEHYFDLGIKERDINFRSIWQDSAGFGKRKYHYKHTLDPNQNFALSSLYWISKDFFEKFEDSPNPELKRIKDIRDSLEHKYVKINDSFFEGRTQKYGDGLALYVSDKELYDVTFMLLKILREAIINLSLCVNIAEVPKREAAKDKLIMPMSLMDYEDDWKI